MFSLTQTTKTKPNNSPINPLVSRQSENDLYPATFTPTDGVLLIEFKDFPEAISEGKDFDNALIMASDVLATVADMYSERGIKLPLPSSPVHGDIMIALGGDYA